MHANWNGSTSVSCGGGYGAPVSNKDAAFSRSVVFVSAHFHVGCVVSTRVMLNAAVDVTPKGKGKLYLRPETANGWASSLTWIKDPQLHQVANLQREDQVAGKRLWTERMHMEDQRGFTGMALGKQNPQLGNTLIVGVVPDSEGCMAVRAVEDDAPDKLDRTRVD
ncbi:hypothetical protein EI94DRAFT_1705331 [Lactarius quietus]|nr:hypothetical protein EI94DRAFT_1705331 [Lactarius quietus]